MEDLRNLSPPLVGVLGLLLLCLLLLLALPSLGPSDYTLDDQGPLLLGSLGLTLIGTAGTYMTDRGGRTSSDGHLRRRMVAVLYWGSFAAALLGFAVLKQLVFVSSPGRLFAVDTPTYVRVAERPLLSQPFWFGERPFTVPLLYKLLDVTSSNYDQASAMLKIQRTQAWLAASAWILLAGVVARSVRARWLRPFAFGLVLVFGVNLHVSQWDRILLSESISTTLFVGTIGMLIALLLPKEVGFRAWWMRGLIWLSMCGQLVLFSFTRDGNLPILALATLAMIIAAAIGFLHGSATRWLRAAMVLVLLGAVAGQLRGIEFSDRWKIPYYGVLQDRILVEKTSRDYFHQRGMPSGKLSQEILTMERRDFLDGMRTDDRFNELRAWVEDNGRPVYLSHLLRRPIEVLASPIRQHAQLLNPLSTEYRNPEAETPGWLRAVSALFYPRQTPVVVIWIALLICGFVLAARRDRLRAEWYVGVAMAAVAYPMMILAWYGDSIEVERHAYQAAFQLRLALWLLSLWLVDAFLSGGFGFSDESRQREHPIRLSG